MSHTATAPHEGDAPRGERRSLARAGFAAVLLVAAVAAAFLTGRATNSGIGPTDSSAEAGFARDMQTHHAQAVEMSMLVRDRTDDPAVRLLAYDIALTQQQQIGQMAGWLAQWGLPPASGAPPMGWMTEGGSMGGHPMGGAQDPLMPGLASEEDLEGLEAATGRDADVRYLELMVAHHRGGVTMAQGLLDRSDDAIVTGLARTIVTSQQADIDAMLGMLLERQTS